MAPLLAQAVGRSRRMTQRDFSMEWDSPGDPYAGTAGLIEKTLKNLS